MSKSEDVIVSAWPHDDVRHFPDRATFLCCYEVFGYLYEREERAYFWRVTGTAIGSYLECR